MVCVGTDSGSSRRAVEIAHSYAGVWATVGLHPHEASRLEEERDALRELIGTHRVVGVGETGFDFHYMHSAAAAQEQAFREQIRLAKEAELALVVHTREAWDETFRVLDDEGPPRSTVFHCFTGGPEEARRAVALGAFVSFSGIVTFPNAGEVRAATRSVAPERLLVETDSPFLAPVPHRGRRNEPGHVVHVAEGVAAATGHPLSLLEETTAAAAVEVFGLGERASENAVARQDPEPDR